MSEQGCINKQVLIVTALAGFVRSFLEHDIKLLQSEGYEVHCAANKNHPAAGKIEEYFDGMGVIFHQIDFSSNKPFSRKTLKALKQVRELVRNHNFSVVHSHTPIAGTVSRWVCRKNRKIGMKVFYTTHGFYFHDGSSKKSWLIFRNIEDFMSRLTDVIVTINREDYRNAKKMHCANVKYINGIGVDIQRFTTTTINREMYREQLGIAADAFMILAIGELSKRKNHQLIIRALGEIKIPNAVFVICGNAMNSDATTGSIQSLSKELGIDTRLVGLRSDIPEICHCADIGVIPSTREGLGLSGVEMLASGLPVVGAKVQGIVDYISDGVNGYLCNAYDVHEFARAIEKLHDCNTRESMRDKCIESAKPFDIAISHLQMEKIYAEFLQ